MPIRRDLRHHYKGRRWQEIRAHIMKRAGNKCEQCQKPHGVDREVARGGYWLDPSVGAWRDDNGELVTRPVRLQSQRNVRVVVCVAHLNHQPADNRDENLKALCQHCHLKHDYHKHFAQARRTIAAAVGQLWLTPELERDVVGQVDRSPHETRKRRKKAGVPEDLYEYLGSLPVEMSDQEVLDALQNGKA